MEWIIGFLQGPPVWVWPLLGLLIWVGMRASRDRTTHVAGYYAFPFLVLMTLNSMLAMTRPEIAWPIFIAMYLGGVWAGYRYQRSVVIERKGRFVQVRGEWVTMAAVMAMFSLGFVKGFLGAMAPEMLVSIAGVALIAALSGGLSGQFAGRALCILRPVA